ncbi:hypothetical protein FNU76_10170 [Chitinimonas arctica]|uniref:Uncharacterized protein n=1 Tax=Chitinimonas arctica TaxID=2594795 RepID=A0A516SEW2_9NEIS|nr:hypothetical protein [Chitinimonas arctica]QDQ26699.1 hypothetical protein FNU76_10170 [Chitinimonas arctica]
MQNILLAYRHYFDTATVTGGSWQAGAPLANLKTRIFSEVARSTNALASNTLLDIDLGQVRPIALVSLVDHNLSEMAQWRVTAYSNAGYTHVVWQQDWQRVWPRLGLGAMDWEDPGYWSGLIPAERLDQYRALSIATPDRSRARYWRIEIDDTANPAGYVQLGRVYVSDGWQPEANLSYGRALGYESRSQIIEADDGTEFGRRRKPCRVVQGELAWLSKTEAYDRVLQIQREADVIGEVFYVEDAADPASLLQRAFPGRLRKLSAIEWPFFNTHRTGIEIKEII